MQSHHWDKLLFVSSLLLAVIAAGDSVTSSHQFHTPPPSRVLWAWERPEDLRFLPAGTGVAYLVSTIQLSGNKVVEHPRMNPLLVPPGVRLMGVVRIESDGHAIPAQTISRVADMITLRAALPQIEGLQIDFDARRSQRESFRSLLRELRHQLPRAQSLSITALASWCQGDDWLSGMPIDYAVPMLFRLGPERDSFRSAATQGRIFREPLCRNAIGLSTDEAISIPHSESVFLFSATPWSAPQYEQLGQPK